ITLAGVVTSARVITTKKGDPMAFVQVEDPSGSVEITVFPKTYGRSRELWRVEALVLVKGKVELREGKLQVLCEMAEEYRLEVPETSPAPVQATTEPSTVQIAIPDETEAAIAETILTAQIEDERADMPPMPEAPPDEFSSRPPVLSHPKVEPSSAVAVGDQETANRAAPVAVSAHVAESQPVYAAPPNIGTGDAVAYAGTARREQPRHLRIYLERAGDYDEEVRRLRELLNLLRSVQGRDRFTFFVPNPQGMVQLDFPNFTTSYAVVEDTLNQLVSEWGALEVQ
ncbi:MAG TPA: OB-fold nucleic acid binding domain-containing protein, partial [Anaerolineae bacterium]